MNPIDVRKTHRLSAKQRQNMPARLRNRCGIGCGDVRMSGSPWCAHCEALMFAAMPVLDSDTRKVVRQLRWHRAAFEAALRLGADRATLRAILEGTTT